LWWWWFGSAAHVADAVRWLEFSVVVVTAGDWVNVVG
jgi:hypothetical protein